MKALPNEEVKKILRQFALDTPKRGYLLQPPLEPLIISGWALPFKPASIRLIVQDGSLITHHQITINRPDVIKHILAETEDSNIYLKCGFKAELNNYSKVFKVGFEIDSTLYWIYEISYRFAYHAETSEHNSLNGIVPVIFKEKDVFILTGSKFTLMTPNYGIIEDSEYLWKDKWREHLATGAIKSTKYYKGLSVIAGNSSKDNYYHWLFQVFPSLIFCIANAKSKDEKIRVLGPTLNKFNRQYLALLDNIEYIEVPDESLIVAEEAIFSNLLWGDFSFKPIRFIGDILPKIPPPNNQTSKRLYISRGDTKLRRVRNEADVISLMNNFGFEAVNLSELSVPEQINIFKSAEAVAGPHGAGLTNLLFAQKGTLVIELMQDNYINECFKFISMGRELKYHSIINPTKINGLDKHHDEMVVDLSLLEKTLLTLQRKYLP